MGPRASIRLAAWLVGLMLGAGFAFLLALAGPASASADPYMPPAGIATEPDFPESGKCPAGGYGAYSGSDDAAGEVRNLREEITAMCVALADRQDEFAHRLWWVVAEQLAAAEQRATANALINDVKAELASPLAVSIDTAEPLPVQDAAAQQYTDDVVTAVDASGTASKAALYFIAGLIVAGAMGYLLSKAVDRGT